MRACVNAERLSGIKGRELRKAANKSYDYKVLRLGNRQVETSVECYVRRQKFEIFMLKCHTYHYRYYQEPDFRV